MKKENRQWNRTAFIITVSAVLVLLAVFFVISRKTPEPAAADTAAGEAYLLAGEEKDPETVRQKIASAREEAAIRQEEAEDPAAEDGSMPAENNSAEEAETEEWDEAGSAAEAEQGGLPDYSELEEQIDTFSVRELTPEETASYMQRFENTVVVGDSMAQAVLEYELLDANHVKYLRSASITQLDEQIDEALAMLPDKIIFFMGLNDVDVFAEDLQGYHDAWTARIQAILDSDPSVEIYICSLLPPSEAMAEERPDLARSPEFDSLIRQVCQETAASYIDCLWMVRQPYYLEDEIHFNRDFYIIWLQTAALAAGI